MLYRYLLLVLLVFAPGVLAEGLPDLGDASQASFSGLEEKRLGDEIMREIRADKDYYDDPEATDYLNTLGTRLVSKGAESRQDFQFFFMQDRQINAFAL